MMKDTKPKETGNDKDDIASSKKNPYKRPALIRLLGVILCCAGYLTMRFYVDMDHYPMFKTLSYIVISGLTLSVVPYIRHYFGYKKFKKTHPDIKYDVNYYENEEFVDSYPYRRR